MKKLIVTLTILSALAIDAIQPGEPDQEMLERVYLDAQVIKRVAEVAHRDLPRELLSRIIEQDIDMLRGKQADGTYTQAHFEPIEADRVREGFSVSPREEGDRLDRSQFRAKNVFKLIVDVPSRRFLVVRNSDIFLDRIEISYDDQNGISKSETFDVGRRIDAGESMEFELPEVASDAVATVYARSENKNANMELIFVKAELVDNANSPYFGVVQSAKLLQEAIERRDQTAMQSLASTMGARLETFLSPRAPAQVVTRAETIPSPRQETADAIDSPPILEIYLQLQRIEDLLNGSSSDRRDGMDRLDRLIRELRSSALDAAERR